jgi:CDP-glucose 4,6-dehydratase
MFGDHYRNRRVLITGHTGFKGSWLTQWLHGLGAHVSGFSDRAPDRGSLGGEWPAGILKDDLRGDIRDPIAIAKAVRKTKPEVVFHLAAQPLVRLSYREPLATLNTNVTGTANLLEAVRTSARRIDVVVVTTDKCYENRNWHHGYRESDPLGGHDVYSASKAATELVVQSWRRSFFDPSAELGNIASARGGNVIGGGDYSDDRIVPDCVRSLKKGRAIEVRNPAATRPWQHVLDCLSGYLLLGWRLGTTGKNSPFAEAFNFGPPIESNRSVQDLVETALGVWPGEWRHTDDPSAPHEATLLHLSTDKAAQMLKWFPVWDFSRTVRETIGWYHLRHTGRRADMVEFTIRQIEHYGKDASAKGLVWTQTTR